MRVAERLIKRKIKQYKAQEAKYKSDTYTDITFANG